MVGWVLWELQAAQCLSQGGVAQLESVGAMLIAFFHLSGSVLLRQDDELLCSGGGQLHEKRAG